MIRPEPGENWASFLCFISPDWLNRDQRRVFQQRPRLCLNSAPPPHGTLWSLWHVFLGMAVYHSGRPDRNQQKKFNVEPNYQPTQLASIKCQCNYVIKGFSRPRRCSTLPFSVTNCAFGFRHLAACLCKAALPRVG